VGSRILAARSATALGAVGILSGLMVQGKSMATAVQAVLPKASETVTAEALFVVVGAFVFAKALRAPMSLSMSLVALMLGLSTSRHLPIDYAYSQIVVIMWVAAPLIAVAFGFLFLKTIDRVRVEDVWRRIAIYKILLIGCSFLAAYVLGANTVGLIVAIAGFNSLTVLTAVPAVLLGCIFLSGGEIRRVGENLFSMRYANALASLLVSIVLVEFATLLAIPLSSTQTLSAGVLGAGSSYKSKLISLRPLIVIVAAWIMVPTISFIVGYIL
jgi:PiT family inorganic phosphate transporter